METDNTKMFNELFYELEHCRKDKQRKKIGEMNEIIDEMNEEEHKFVFKTELYNKMNKMIEKKKMSMENATWMLKHIGYCKALKNVWNRCFEYSTLNERFERMIIEEEKKKEEKNKRLLIDLCEFYVLLNDNINSEIISICVPCLLKVASDKEESGETRKEVEIALLALSNIENYFLRQELYLKEITEIIEYQKKHRNLTRLAYWSVWDFLIHRLLADNSLEEVIVNELHFSREAARELEELTRNVNWKKKEEEMNKEEAKEKLTLKRWLETFSIYFLRCKLWNEENAGVINSIVQVYRAAKGDNHRGISDWCTYPLRNASENRVVKINDLLKGRAVEAVLEEIRQPTLDDNAMRNCLYFFLNVSKRLKRKTNNEANEAKRIELKRKIFENMEEEGYEDTITSFQELLKNK
eukprot:MONOS_15408.1-p1 / transcript=MONOS_15408.1 / gene=MONOS_15408 / organism=Monocercomonoides_exilis_PA203 / gene_product=unspecified product / transcript_product=unspecified product / location=Mono_scaffold01223:9027-10680(-) / protein_length=411 / sequence_SO=supercontig / SO=protein_coding / is_pseudo=false